MNDVDGVGQAAGQSQVRGAPPDLHDWTLHEHVRGLLALLDAREAPAAGKTPTADQATDAADVREDAADLVRMDSDLG